MSTPAILVEDLGKQYKLGARAAGDAALRSTISHALSYPIRRFRALGEHATESERFWALEDVSFAVQPGEIVGIIGRNGAGKSTLLKILSRITEPTRGRAVLHGQVGSLLEVGTGFHPELTGRENTYLNGAILGIRKADIDRDFDEIVAFAEVEKFLDTPVKRYSSGMRVRLAFAVAAYLQPEILLVDEVLAVGDANFQRKCLRKMDNVAKEGRTVLLVSHNMGSIKQLCSRAVLLEQGRVKCIGRTHDVVNTYLALGDVDSGARVAWPEARGPGDDSVRLTAIRLCGSSGETRSEFGTHEPVCVEARYRVLRRLSGFRLGFSLHGMDGTYIFYTSDEDVHGDGPPERCPGDYSARCRIPADLLNVGAYRVQISGGIFGVRPVFLEVPQLTFTVISTGGATSRFREARSGILAPSLPWETCNVPGEGSACEEATLTRI